jgi:hypothetical protein
MHNLARRLLITAAIAIWVFPTSDARAACDASGTDAAVLATAHASIDAACPCQTADSPSAYRHCARQIVRALVSGASLPRTCSQEASRYATKSVCGRPGAVVCCRVRDNGRVSHRVFADPAACVDGSRLNACISDWQSVVTGCNASGCVPSPVCGNAIVEPGEDCDPPDLYMLTCDASCHVVACETVPAACGNGIIEAGEACEPPGVASCGRDCQLAACQAPALGEIDVACVEGGTAVAVGAASTGYLVAWTGPHRRDAEILARRFDHSGAGADGSLTVVSEALPCASYSSGPEVTFDGTDYYVAWSAYTVLPGAVGVAEQAIYGRRLGGTAGTAAMDQLASTIPFGICRTNIGGPTSVAAVAPALFAVGWQTVATCLGNVIYRSPVGALIDFTTAPTQTGVPLGYPRAAPPTAVSSSAASVASLAGDTLWVWYAIYAASPTPPYEYFVAAAWTSAGATTAPIVLTTRRPFVNNGRPGVAAGSASLLVTWAQGADDLATTATEIRAVRVTRPLGRIDVDGGLLLAATSTIVSSGPVVAFDGTRWLVVWTETAGISHDLRAVAVEADGSVVDPSPRLLATNVAAQEPGAASTGDGKVLVSFVRTDGASSAIRAVLVTP